MQAAIDGGKHEDRSCMVCWRGAEIYLNNYIFLYIAMPLDYH